MRRVDPPANGPSFQRLGTGFKVFTMEDLSQEAQQAKHVVWEAILRNGEVSRQLLIDNIKDIIAPCAGAEISWLGYCLWACSRWLKQTTALLAVHSAPGVCREKRYLQVCAWKSRRGAGLAFGPEHTASCRARFECGTQSQ